ncbi:MAG: exonuclease SbcCD subunit D [Clostridiaceae bacterium]|nr:exonuclease SbcCD subunit D [Clostridiaceae bacterium]
MKIFHLSDLHIGKRLFEFSLIEDQRFILDRILTMAQQENPDAVIIAGDVYDKSTPSAESVILFDDFLSNLCRSRIRVFVISGNHDSPERIAFGSRIVSSSGVYLSPVYCGEIEPVTLSDSHGEVDFYLLPFIKPSHVRRFFPDREINNYSEALSIALKGFPSRASRRNILITHQFVTGASKSDSEDISVGGTDNVDAEVFNGFDYVALGHLHSPQNVGGKHLRYCGSPLKYSVSECNQEKSVTVIELEEKGSLEIRTLPLNPLRDLRKIKGNYMSVTDRSTYEGTDTSDFIHVTLTDENDVPDAMAKLRVIYPNIVHLHYDNSRTRENREVLIDSNFSMRSPIELFSHFYEIQNNQPMDNRQSEIIEAFIESIWEDQK